ncbi:MAG: hypothetical protein ACJ8AD_02570, partial [Gemmatimonadaceae bacterium]
GVAGNEREPERCNAQRTTFDETHVYREGAGGPARPRAGRKEWIRADGLNLQTASNERKQEL